MKKYTLLELVQDILSDFTSDEVNSITDSVEAMQVAQAIKTTYEHIIDGRDWPHLYKLFQLTSWSNSSYPTYFTIPESATELLWVKYDKKIVTYKTPEDFINLLDTRNPTFGNVTSITDPTGISLYINNDRAPQYWTSFDDKYVIFDAYDADVESTLQTSKTTSYGKVLPTFSLEDDFVPDLPAQAFSYLLAESKAHSSIVLNQAPDIKAQEYSVTQRRRLSQEAWKVNGGIKFPNYGRK